MSISVEDSVESIESSDNIYVFNSNNKKNKKKMDQNLKLRSSIQYARSNNL